jgi:hypothetical protein
MQMKRVCLCLCLALGLAAVLRPCPAQTGALDPQVMKVALHTATPQEGGFIDLVVQRVDKGTLPLDLVQSTFLWARKKPARKFFYFKLGLIQRAAAQGIRL